MRRIQEFKSYQSTIEYDPQTGEFVSRPVPDERMEMTFDDALKPWADVLPFPEPVPVPKDLVVPLQQQKQTKAG
ncbi:MAG: hypothetical protein WCC66_11580 [Rhizobiaceae bacterium]